METFYNKNWKKNAIPRLNGDKTEDKSQPNKINKCCA
jgi:hypothetical protein